MPPQARVTTQTIVDDFGLDGNMRILNFTDFSSDVGVGEGFTQGFRIKDSGFSYILLLTEGEDYYPRMDVLIIKKLDYLSNLKSIQPLQRLGFIGRIEGCFSDRIT